MTHFVHINNIVGGRSTSAFIKFGDNHPFGDNRFDLAFNNHLEVKVRNTRPGAYMGPIRPCEFEFELIADAAMGLVCHFDPTDATDGTYNISIQDVSRPGHYIATVAITSYCAMKLHRALMQELRISPTDPNVRSFTRTIEVMPPGDVLSNEEKICQETVYDLADAGSIV